MAEGRVFEDLDRVGFHEPDQVGQLFFDLGGFLPFFARGGVFLEPALELLEGDFGFLAVDDDLVKALLRLRFLLFLGLGLLFGLLLPFRGFFFEVLEDFLGRRFLFFGLRLPVLRPPVGVPSELLSVELGQRLVSVVAVVYGLDRIGRLRGLGDVS
jgi:hypothetical protein